MRWVLVILAAFGCSTAMAAEVIPPVPKLYFNDYAGVVSASTATTLNHQLEDFERETSNQLLVAIFPKMQSDSSIEDYTVRVAEAWKVGQKTKSNGAVLFVFVQDHKMFLQVGYGLEAVIPDATAKQIIDNEIKPPFKNGDFDGGVTAGVKAIIAATRGEYKGNGSTVDQNKKAPKSATMLVVLGAFVVLWLIMAVIRARRGVIYSGRGWSALPWFMLNALLNSGSSSGRGGGGWSGGGGGGGFSGGGGSFGGGGAGGSW